jgi:dTDP-4-dehydrorhamnose reductase
MKVMVIGANGSLGSELCNQLRSEGINFVPITRNELDISININLLENFIKESKADVIINCAAFLGIENCKENTEIALEVNTFLPNKLFSISIKNNISFIQISTECVFACDDAKLNNFENDIAIPNTTYGLTKRLGECFQSDKFYLIRLPLLFGSTNKEQIISKLSNKAIINEKIKVSNDIYTSPVYTPNVAKWITNNIKDNFTNFPNIVHLNSSSRISLYDFMLKILTPLNKESSIISVSSDSFPSSEPKPKFGGLSSHHHEGFDLDEMVNSYCKILKNSNEKGH